MPTTRPGSLVEFDESMSVCAELTGDNPLRAYTRWVQSNVAYWRGDYRRAADIAHAGQEFATSGSSRLRLTSQEARALAVANDRSAFRHAIGAARDARDDLEALDEVGVFRFSPGKAAYYASEAYCAMGNADDIREAQGQAREAVRLLRDDPDEQGIELLTAAQLDLADAYLAATELDGAAVLLSEVFCVPPEHRTVPVVQRVRRIGGQLAGHGDVPAVMALREQASLFTAHVAATPQLPEGSR